MLAKSVSILWALCATAGVLVYGGPIPMACQVTISDPSPVTTWTTGRKVTVDWMEYPRGCLPQGSKIAVYASQLSKQNTYKILDYIDTFGNSSSEGRFDWDVPADFPIGKTDWVLSMVWAGGRGYAGSARFSIAHSTEEQPQNALKAPAPVHFNISVTSPMRNDNWKLSEPSKHIVEYTFPEEYFTGKDSYITIYRYLVNDAREEVYICNQPCYTISTHGATKDSQLITLPSKFMGGYDFLAAVTWGEDNKLVLSSTFGIDGSPVKPLPTPDDDGPNAGLIVVLVLLVISLFAAVYHFVKKRKKMESLREGFQNQSDESYGQTSSDAGGGYGGYHDDN